MLVCRPLLITSGENQAFRHHAKYSYYLQLGCVYLRLSKLGQHLLLCVSKYFANLETPVTVQTQFLYFQGNLSTLTSKQASQLVFKWLVHLNLSPS